MIYVKYPKGHHFEGEYNSQDFGGVLHMTHLANQLLNLRIEIRTSMPEYVMLRLVCPKNVKVCE